MLPFSKYQGLGNDFLLLDARSLEVAAELGRLLDAERIRRKIEGMKVMNKGARIPVTASLGVSARIDKGVERMIEFADQSLYAAKENGRNRVYFWGASGPEPSPLAALSKAAEESGAVEA